MTRLAQLGDVRQILVINLGGIGDVLLSTPALRALKATYPRARLTVMAVPRVKEMLSGFSFIDEAVCFYYGEGYLTENILELFRLRLRKFDLAINMRTLVSEKSAHKMRLLFDIVNPRISAGRNTDGRGGFFHISIPESGIGDKHEMEYDIDMVRALGAEVGDRTIGLVCAAREEKRVNDLLAAHAVHPRHTLIGIHPGGKASHRWPIGHFSRVINEISMVIPCVFVLTGSKEERELGEKLLLQQKARVVNLAGELRMQELSCLIRRCRLFISNDTAPMHMAAIVGTPLVAIFGPGYLRRFDPRYLADKVVTLYKKCACAPCDKNICDDNRCLMAIGTDEVLEASFRLLEEENYA